LTTFFVACEIFLSPSAWRPVLKLKSDSRIRRLRSLRPKRMRTHTHIKKIKQRRISSQKNDHSKQKREWRRVLIHNKKRMKKTLTKI
jgi:hypothetical protein